jgi:hypothetical protein
MTQREIKISEAKESADSRRVRLNARDARVDLFLEYISDLPVILLLCVRICIHSQRRLVVSRHTLEAAMSFARGPYHGWYQAKIAK